MDTLQAWLEGELSARGWSLADLARQARINPSSLSRVLTGSRRAGPELCRAIAEALKVPPEEVFRRAGLLPGERQVDEVAEELLYYLSAMAPDDRRLALAIVRTLFEAADKSRQILEIKRPQSRSELLRFLDSLSEEEIASLAEAMSSRTARSA